MNSNVFCPISFAKIDENVARINAAQTVLLLGLYFATQSILPVLLLLVDFVCVEVQCPVQSAGHSVETGSEDLCHCPENGQCRS
jgi:hypothetical protein